jgi:hypothetical protein
MRTFRVENENQRSSERRTGLRDGNASPSDFLRSGSSEFVAIGSLTALWSFCG